jgi:F-type H+-transporting ATPase subunit a
MFKLTENNFSLHNNTQMDVISPLDQFEIRDILNVELLAGNLHLSLTNIGLYLVIGALAILATSIISTNYNKLVSNN